MLAATKMVVMKMVCHLNLTVFGDTWGDKAEPEIHLGLARFLNEMCAVGRKNIVADSTNLRVLHSF